LGRNDPGISPKPGQQISLLEVIMELVAIQVIIFGVIILVYLSQEFDK
jgi:hypothetical protein